MYGLNQAGDMITRPWPLPHLRNTSFIDIDYRYLGWWRLHLQSTENQVVGHGVELNQGQWTADGKRKQNGSHDCTCYDYGPSDMLHRAAQRGKKPVHLRYGLW